MGEVSPRRRAKKGWHHVSQFSPEVGSPESKRPARPKRWRCIIYHDNRYKFDEVVTWLQDLVGCKPEFAIRVCDVCQNQGRAVCFQGSKERCHEITAALRSRGIQAEVDDF